MLELDLRRNITRARIGRIRGKLSSFLTFLWSSKKTILLILVVAVASIAITTAISILLSSVHDLRVPSLGTIRTIGIEAYWDPNCETRRERIYWGMLFPGSSRNETLYIRSTSNFKAPLNLSVTNWNPTNISDYMNLSWSYDGTPLNPGEIIQVTLTLATSSSNSFIQYLISNDVSNFSFDIIISVSAS